MALRRANITDVRACDLVIGHLVKAPPYVVFQMNKLKDVDTKLQTFTVDVFFRILWFNHRLAYDETCLQLGSGYSLNFGSHLEQEIWTPILCQRTRLRSPRCSKAPSG